jgi:putative sigma-54 modulation protein
MKINIKATGISLTTSISEYIEKKINMLDKFFQDFDDVLVNVEVGKISKHHKSGDIFRAEIQITAGGQTYYAESETEDLYAAIDVVKDDIVHELTSKRKKTLRLFRRGGAQIKNLLKGIVDVGDRSWKRLRRKK